MNTARKPRNYQQDIHRALLASVIFNALFVIALATMILLSMNAWGAPTHVPAHQEATTQVQPAATASELQPTEPVQ